MFFFKSPELGAVVIALFTSAAALLAQVHQEACRLIFISNSDSVQNPTRTNNDGCVSYEVDRLYNDACNPSMNGTMLNCDPCPETLSNGQVKKRKMTIKFLGTCTDFTCTGGTDDIEVEYVRMTMCGDSCVAIN